MAVTIDRQKTAFLAMDFQNDLVHEKGKLASNFIAHVKQTNCLANTRKAIEASRKAGIPVIYIIIAFREGYPEMSEKDPTKEVGVFIEGSWGAQIHKDIKPQPGEIIITKRRCNSFYGTELELVLHNKKVSTIVLSGVATNLVVESTARYAWDADYEVVILKDCCASMSQEMHDFALNNMPSMLCTITSSEEYIKALG